MEQRVRVLLVSASQECLRMVANMLVLRFPLSLRLATTPQEAFELMNDFRPDIVVADVYFDGEQPSLICDFCSTSTRKKVVIGILSDTDVTKECFGAENCVVHTIVHKPLDIQELFRGIAQAVEQVELWVGGRGRRKSGLDTV